MSASVSLHHVLQMLHAIILLALSPVNATSASLVTEQCAMISMNASARTRPALAPQRVITRLDRISVRVISDIMATVLPVRTWTSV